MLRKSNNAILKFLILNTFFLTHQIKAQNEDHQIKKSIMTMFDGMAAFDSAMVRSVFAESFTLKTVTTSPDGMTKVRDQTAQDFINAIGTKREGVKYDERLTSIDIKIDREMAMAWTPYRFYLNDAFSHCGVNVFIMAKIKGLWKIVSITDTRRKADCVP